MSKISYPSSPASLFATAAREAPEDLEDLISSEEAIAAGEAHARGEIVEVESAWRETGIACPQCGGVTYSDGKHRPQCGNDDCLELLTDECIWQWLIAEEK